MNSPLVSTYTTVVGTAMLNYLSDALSWISQSCDVHVSVRG